MSQATPTQANRAYELVVPFNYATAQGDLAPARYTFTRAVTLLGWRFGSVLINANAAAPFYNCLVHGSQSDAQSAPFGLYAYNPLLLGTSILDQHLCGPNFTANAALVAKVNTTYRFPPSVYYVVNPNEFLGVSNGGGNNSSASSGTLTILYRYNL